MNTTARKAVITLLFCCCLCGRPVPAFAEAPANPDAHIQAKAAILVEQESGRVLYQRKANDKMYPASMTKILTALVALDYLAPDEIVVAGAEVNAVPYDSSKAGHFAGESLLVENLIRGLIIPSGNETACVAANAVARRVQAGTEMTYTQAEKLFCSLMEKKARALGAKSSNFVNPHGYHSPDHYTTASDMALIARAAMSNPLIAEIADEKEFIGNGAGSMPDPILKTQLYEWRTHNYLIGAGEYSYPYATGIKTGYTYEAGDCLAAAATKDGISLIAIVFDSSDPGRWTDCIRLFDYGFETFAHREVQRPGAILDTVSVANALLGESDTLEITARGSSSCYLSEDELARVQREIFYDGAFLATEDEIENDALDKEKRSRKKDGKDEKASAPETAGGVTLIAPIQQYAVVGEIRYTLEGETIFTDQVIATRGIAERTSKSDRQYYVNELKKDVFSFGAIPYWAGGVFLAAAGLLVIRKISRRRGRRAYGFKNRY